MRSRRNLCAACCGALLSTTFGAAYARQEPAGAAASGDGFLSVLWRRAQESLNEASAALEPPLVPPTPVKVKWRARRVSSVDLAAPLLAVAAGDLDGDNRAELVALTTREVVLLRVEGKRKLVVVSRAELPDDPPAIRPRDPVGTVVVVDLDGDGVREVLARSSESKEGGAYAWRKSELREIGRFEGFPLGGGVFADLEPGRNYFVSSRARWSSEAPPGMPEQFYSAERRDDLVDPAGRIQWVMGFVTPDGELATRLHTRCRASDGDACPGQSSDVTIPDVGVAFEVADVNRDGYPEAIVSANGPPGDPDRVTVFTMRGGRPEKLYRRSFGGGVVGLAAADFDGNGDLEVFAAVRLLGSHRVDVWTLN